MTSPPEMDVDPWSLYGGLFIDFQMFVLVIARLLQEEGRVRP